MQSVYYVALDIHKETTRHCVKDVSGSLHAEGSIHATHPDLDPWKKTLPQPGQRPWKPRFSPAGSTIIPGHTLLH